jgi:hypothetical protein
MTLLEMARECDTLKTENANLKRTLASLIETVESVQRSGQYWFGPFRDSTDDGLVYWPEIGTIAQQAREQLGFKIG